jgi:Holliday junction resolvase-like predicted endonuclease
MGVYCNLFIGSKDYSWKGYIPDIIALLFDKDDYRSIYDEDNKLSEHKFVTNCGNATTRLLDIGINLETFRNLHFEYYAFNYKNYKDNLRYRCSSYLSREDEKVLTKNVNRMAEYFLNRYFVKLDKNEEFNRVQAFNKCYGSVDDYLQKNIENKNASEQDPSKYDRSKFERDYLRDFLKEDPYLYHLEDEFSDEETGSLDLNDLYDIGLKILASDKNIPIEFEFTEFIDSNKSLNENAVNKFLFEMRLLLHRRNILSAEVFNKILARSSGIENSLINKLSIIPSAKEKGQFLEDLIENIFNKQKGFKISRNIRHSGEEIDLVIMNKIDDPFWNSLQSPLIIVECKNQKKKTDSKEIRIFEGKILEKKSLCKLGIFISTSGFTKGSYELARRCGRDGYKILLVDKNKLDIYQKDSFSLLEWLEGIILEQC